MVKHKLARRALQKWAKERGNSFTTQDAKQFLYGKSKTYYHLSQNELNNVLGKTKKVKSRDGVMYGYRGELISQSKGQRMVWEYVEHD
tara:strand:+ start:1180 stop:1443 length:264 start_codon:yes stop_codon:yes gene_type:complete